jgi:hypothetical protein
MFHTLISSGILFSWAQKHHFCIKILQPFDFKPKFERQKRADAKPENILQFSRAKLTQVTRAECSKRK